MSRTVLVRLLFRFEQVSVHSRAMPLVVMLKRSVPSADHDSGMCSSPWRPHTSIAGRVGAISGLPPDSRGPVVIGLKRNPLAVVRPGRIAVVALRRRQALRVTGHRSSRWCRSPLVSLSASTPAATAESVRRHANRTHIDLEERSTFRGFVFPVGSSTMTMSIRWRRPSGGPSHRPACRCRKC